MMIIPKPPLTLTLESVYIAAIALSCIVGLETAILLGLRLRLGSMSRLMRLAITSKRHYKPTNKRGITNEYVKKDSNIAKSRNPSVGRITCSGLNKIWHKIRHTELDNNIYEAEGGEEQPANHVGILSQPNKAVNQKGTIPLQRLTVYGNVSDFVLSFS